MLRDVFSRMVAAVTLLTLIIVAMPATASAYTIRDGVDCSAAGARDSTVCQTTSSADPLTGKTGIIHSATLLIAVIAGAAAIIVMVVAGIKYITSGGEPDEVGKAKKTIIFAAVGLVVIVAGQAIINFVISKV